MKPLEIFIPTAPGLQSITISELKQLNIKIHEISKEGLLILGHWNAVYRLNLFLKTVSRIYVRLNTYKVRHFSELAEVLKQIDFSPYMSCAKVCIKVNSYRSRLYHENAIKEIIFKHLSERFADLPLKYVGTADEDETQTFMFNIINNQMQVSVDTSGQSLYKRGYQVLRSEAPIRESLVASAYISLQNNHYQRIIDPFCGSSTIPLEWMMLNKQLMNNSFRDFAFMRFKNFNTQLYTSQFVIHETNHQIEYEAYDIDDKCIRISRENYIKLEIEEQIKFEQADFLNLNLSKQANSVIITNPPWGKRIDPKSLYLLYRKLQELSNEMPVFCFLPKDNLSYFKKHRILFQTKSGTIDIVFVEILN